MLVNITDFRQQNQRKQKQRFTFERVSDAFPFIVCPIYLYNSVPILDFKLIAYSFLLGKNVL